MSTELPIPIVWREMVNKILRSNDLRNIEWTFEAINEWQLQTNGAWQFECHDAMLQALKQAAVVGRRIELRERGESYAFWYRFDSRIFYGKICLRIGGIKIKIVSAHLPERGTEKL